MAGKRAFWNELVKLWPSGGGEPEVQLGTGGRGHVRPIGGTGNTASNRYQVPDAAYAVGTNSVTWTSGENVTELYITVFGDAATTTDDHAWIVFDAPDTATAITWLGQAASASATTQKVGIPYGVRVGPFTGTSYFSRLDVDLTDNGVMFVEAQ